MPTRTPQLPLAIIGGGLAGALVALHLLRRLERGGELLVIEPRAELGRGIAYSTSDPLHLLNVPMERLSAHADRPHDFVHWVRERQAAEPGAFLPRGLYGSYVADRLAVEASRRPDIVLHHLRDRVRALDGSREGPYRLHLDHGASVQASAAVLALGNLPARRPAWLPEDPRISADPWGTPPIPGGQRILVIGTGLTAIDCLLSAAANDPRSEILAVSTSGRFPYTQLGGRREPLPPLPFERNPRTVAELGRLLAGHLRSVARTGGAWQDALDGFRPRIQELWTSLDRAEQQRFLRRHARAWELRRHRMAPEVAARLAALLQSGRLRVMAGRVDGVTPRSGQLQVRIRTGQGERIVDADRVILCAGLNADVTTTPDPLVQQLLASGRARPDPLRLGLAAAVGGRLLDADGLPQNGLRILGPPLRGTLWETTAARECRDQAEHIARKLASSPQAVPPLATAPV